MIQGDLFARLAPDDYEEIVVAQHRATGLRAFLVIHDTTLGPAHGGTRIRRYTSDGDALEDALRLGRAMTFKAALAGLPSGGGKIVVRDHDDLVRAEAFRTLGRFVQSLGGRLFTGGDLGTTAADLRHLREETEHVATPDDPRMGDLAEPTARGVFAAMRACCTAAGVELDRATVAIQGVGGVGLHLAHLLAERGCRLIAADTDAAAAARANRETGARLVPPEEIYDAPAEVFSPCAVGGTVNVTTIERLSARVICGGANNVLGARTDGAELTRRGVVFAPDYVANAGALIHGANVHLLGRTDNLAAIEAIEPRTQEIVERAAREQRSAQEVADEMALACLRRPKRASDLWWPGPGSPLSPT